VLFHHFVHIFRNLLFLCTNRNNGQK
jgi:hypothetical protein